MCYEKCYKNMYYTPVLCKFERFNTFKTVNNYCNQDLKSSSVRVKSSFRICNFQNVKFAPLSESMMWICGHAGHTLILLGKNCG